MKNELVEQATQGIKKDSPYREVGVATHYRPLSKDRGFSLYGDFIKEDSMGKLNCSIGGRVCVRKDAGIGAGEFILSSMKVERKTNKPKLPTWLMPLVVIVVMMILAVLMSSCSPDEAWATECSWYSVQSLKEEGSWAKWGGITKSGEKFSDDLFTGASNRYPIGSLLWVWCPRTNRGCVIRVNDTMSKKYSNRLDLSISAFSAISDTSRGLEEVTTERIR